MRAGEQRSRCPSPTTASRDELVSQRREVFDDAVVDNGDPSVVTDMRMCVVVGWSSVGGPPGVPDTRGGLRERVLADEGLEIDELARLLPDLKAPLTDHRHAGQSRTWRQDYACCTDVSGPPERCVALRIQGTATARRLSPGPDPPGQHPQWNRPVAVLPRHSALPP